MKGEVCRIEIRVRVYRIEIRVRARVCHIEIRFRARVCRIEIRVSVCCLEIREVECINSGGLLSTTMVLDKSRY